MPLLAQAYTGITIVMSAQTLTNKEFIDTFKAELVNTKNSSLRVKIINLQEVEKLEVAENSELVIALGVKALAASANLKFSTPVLGVNMLCGRHSTCPNKRCKSNLSVFLFPK